MDFGSEIIKDSSAQIISNGQRPPPNFRNIVNIETHIDNVGVVSSITPRFLTMKDIRSCYKCNIGEIRDFEVREAYEKLCVNGILKEKFKIIVDKGLTCALGFPNIFKVEWINIVLN